MAIWQYSVNRLGVNDKSCAHNISGLWMACRHTTTCLYCNQALESIVDLGPGVNAPTALFNDILMFGRSSNKRTSFGISDRRHFHSQVFEHYLKCCPFCGWWVGLRNEISQKSVLRTFGGMGGLKIFDPADLTQPLSEVRSYLMANYDARFTIDSKVFERVVADVFKGLGYSVRVTGRSGDRGIDVILDGNDNTIIGVQVKRYKEKIEAGQIRELTGALVLQGMTKGIFVTTSGFQPGAITTAEASTGKGYPIELLDAKRFYDALKISQLNSFSESDWRLSVDLQLIDKMTLGRR